MDSHLRPGPLLEFKNVSRRFGKNVAVQDLSFSVGPGEVLLRDFAGRTAPLSDVFSHATVQEQVLLGWQFHAVRG